jgi:hypothetical protein
MIRARALETSSDLCCLPSPHRINQCVAGMAFNFSKVELSHHATQRPASRPLRSQPRRAVASRARVQAPRFGT